MASSFASRLSSLRQKKISAPESEQTQLRLTMPADQSQKSSYQPSATFSNTRTSFRLLKGRIQRKQSTEKPQISSNNAINQFKGLNSTQKLSLPEEGKSNLKLVLNDEPFLQEKKPISEPPKIPLQKRILIAKEPPKEEPKREEPPPREQPRMEQPPLPPKMQKQGSKQIINAHEQKPIREEQAQESLPPESQNDLVMCPEGCGRKFNRKALEKHAKACKLVFMSKRKEFNSEAKRISKEQAAITKQNKLQEKKKMGMTRGKGFDKTKTGENWKAASEDFRAAIKAIKKQQKEEQEEGEGEQQEQEEKKVVNVTCQYCQKLFNQVFIEKHMQNCAKKKQKERSRDTKKKTTKK